MALGDVRGGRAFSYEEKLKCGNNSGEGQKPPKIEEIVFGKQRMEHRAIRALLEDTGFSLKGTPFLGVAEPGILIFPTGSKLSFSTSPCLNPGKKAPQMTHGSAPWESCTSTQYRPRSLPLPSPHLFLAYSRKTRKQSCPLSPECPPHAIHLLWKFQNYIPLHLLSLIFLQCSL